MAEPIRVLYLEGDAPASRYVRNALASHDFKILEGGQAIAKNPDVDVCVLSDLPLTRLGAANEEWLVDHVMEGLGLMTVGGWNSYGRGLYANSALAEHLPVRVETGDDRINLSSGACLLPGEAHPITDGLSFDPPPMIAGFNRVRPRRGGKILVEARRVTSYAANRLELANYGDPIVVAAEMTGRTLAVATDLAPHWSGGLTDWGDEMLRFADGTEMGTMYVQFVRAMVAWCAKREIVPAPALTSR